MEKDKREITRIKIKVKTPYKIRHVETFRIPILNDGVLEHVLDIVYFNHTHVGFTEKVVGIQDANEYEFRDPEEALKNQEICSSFKNCLPRYIVNGVLKGEILPLVDHNQTLDHPLSEDIKEGLRRAAKMKGAKENIDSVEVRIKKPYKIHQYEEFSVPVTKGGFLVSMLKIEYVRDIYNDTGTIKTWTTLDPQRPTENLETVLEDSMVRSSLKNYLPTYVMDTIPKDIKEKYEDLK